MRLFILHLKGPELTLSLPLQTSLLCDILILSRSWLAASSSSLTTHTEEINPSKFALTTLLQVNPSHTCDTMGGMGKLNHRTDPDNLIPLPTMTQHLVKWKPNSFLFNQRDNLKWPVCTLKKAFIRLRILERAVVVGWALQTLFPPVSRSKKLRYPQGYDVGGISAG